MKDIETRADLEVLMASFYEKLLADNRIGYIFTDIAKINLPEHLPKIVDFWELTLFNTGSYQTNVMRVHLDLNQKAPFEALHFKVWLDHLYATTDAHFAGPRAEMLKTRALSIATVMQIKIA